MPAAVSKGPVLAGSCLILHGCSLLSWFVPYLIGCSPLSCSRSDPCSRSEFCSGSKPCSRSYLCSGSNSCRRSSLCSGPGLAAGPTFAARGSLAAGAIFEAGPAFAAGRTRVVWCVKAFVVHCISTGVLRPGPCSISSFINQPCTDLPSFNNQTLFCTCCQTSA